MYNLYIYIVIFILLHMYMYFAFIKSFVFTLIEKSAKLIRYNILLARQFLLLYNTTATLCGLSRMHFFNFLFMLKRC